MLLGLRDIRQMGLGADSVLYAIVLSSRADVLGLLGGSDYLVFMLLHPITSSLLDLKQCFFLLHLLYLPIIYLIFRAIRKAPGVFYLLAGWMMFVNSGILLLANFFRQGICVLFFLGLLVSFCASQRNLLLKRLGTLILPFAHTSAALLVPGLFGLKMRRFVLITSFTILVFCAALYAAPSVAAGKFAGYFSAPEQDIQGEQLVVKVIGIYVMLFTGHILRTKIREYPPLHREVLRACVGFLAPTVAFLFTIHAPIIGLRFLYFSYAVAFLYLACIVVLRGSRMLYAASAVGIALFGLVTWTYPSVSRLLVW